MKYRLLSTFTACFLVCAFVVTLFSSSPLSAAAAAKAVTPDSTVSRINRTTLVQGAVYFYDSNTTDDDWTFKSTNADCPATISYTPASRIPASWTLSYQNKNQSGSGCGSTNTKNVTPTNWTERQDIVFAGGSADGKYISVLPDNSTVFKKGGTYNGDTVYIQQGVDAYSCPLVIVTNSRSTALIPLQKKTNEDDVSNQIKTLFGKELGVSDTACGPTDDDDLGIFKQFGLPESYYDAGSEKDHYEETDFGFDGKNVGSATITVSSIAQVAGIAGAGPLAGGGYDGDGSGKDSAGNSTDTGNANATCEVDGFGWVICPLISMMSSAVDAVASFFDDYLQTPPLTTDNGSPLYKGWSNMVGIANILLVIIFLFLVFSQISSIGLSSYGIKKLLPRIIAAAILINLSYYICAILVDVSNILGANIANLINSAFKGVTSDTQQDTGIIGNMKQIGGWITAGAIAAAGLIVVAFFFFIPAVIALLSIFVVIAARSAIITLLIIIAPLAFAAWVLPNTDKWFKKWWDMFLQMLLVYPAVMALFAASSVAAAIVAQGGGQSNLMPLLMGLLIQALPLFALPALIKMTSGVMGRLHNVTNSRLNKMGGDAAHGALQTRIRQTRANTMARMATNNGTGVAGRTGRFVGGYGARRDFKNKQREESARKLQDEAVAHTVLAGGSESRFAAAAAGVGGEAGIRRVQAAAIAHERDESRKRVAAAQQLYSHREAEEVARATELGKDPFKSTLDMYKKDYKKAAEKGDHETMSAILKQVNVKGSPGRTAVAEMLTGGENGEYAIQGAEAQKRVEETVYQDLSLGARSDIVKGEMVMDPASGKGTWKLKDVGGLSSKQIATLDSGVMKDALITKTGAVATTEREVKGTDGQVRKVVEPVISSAQAAEILDTAGLRQEVNDPSLLALLEQRAGRQPGSSVPAAPATAATAASPGELIIPRATGSAGSSDPTQTQQQRQAGGNFNGGPGSTPPQPPTNP